ncbi:MAG: type II toxin-antitoxin system HicB family antitoxin [Corynebacterium sp.]|uniref:type II toxin-antitoxin system HicB family antitoxin n=1 Tax=Corynebacterium sp. TaxID=1720 RepID=UPI0026DC16EA|nr:type II toxin-antitoxin system HicB family antitoxin [Corynebacterium sp.]MDO5030287.1 type II toxin-antitoxin system HicB family antitoxin [Corynebacterium sp.]
MTYTAEKFTYQVFWSEPDQEFVATVLEFPSLSWVADSSSEAEHKLRDLVTEVLADMEASNEKIPEPLGHRFYSGRFNVRISSSLHRKLTMAAAREGISLNAYVAQALASAA